MSGRSERHRTGGRRRASCVYVCVCVCPVIDRVQLPPVCPSSPREIGGGSVMPRKVVLHGAPRRSNAGHSAAPLSLLLAALPSMTAISHGGRIVVDVPHATFQCPCFKHNTVGAFGNGGKGPHIHDL